LGPAVNTFMGFEPQWDSNKKYFFGTRFMNSVDEVWRFFRLIKDFD